MGARTAPNLLFGANLMLMRASGSPWGHAAGAGRAEGGASGGRHMRYYQLGLGLLAIGFVLQLIFLLLPPWAKYSRREREERSRKESPARLHRPRRRGDKLSKSLTDTLKRAP
jgi:hypothetical protein